MGFAAVTVACLVEFAWLYGRWWRGGRVREVSLFAVIRHSLRGLGIEIDESAPSFVNHYRDFAEWDQIAAFLRDAIFVNLSLALVIGLSLWAAATIGGKLTAAAPVIPENAVPAQIRIASALCFAVCFATIPTQLLGSGEFEGYPRIVVSVPIFIAVFSALLFSLFQNERRWRRFSRIGLVLTASVMSATLAIAVITGSNQSATLTAYQMPRAQAPANVLLISIDSLRADHLGCYGYQRNTSPTIDLLASEGTLFETAIAPTSWTIPSHTTLLTALDPLEHGVRTYYTQLHRDTETLAEVLAANGYRTLAAVSGPSLAARYGFHQGFDVYDDYSAIPRNGENLTGITSKRLIASASSLLDDWAANDRQQPFFFFLHMWDVHELYNPPSPHDKTFDPSYAGDFTSADLFYRTPEEGAINEVDVEHVVALYDGELRYTDSQIARLLDKLEEMGEIDNTLVVFTADHGEEFLDHDDFGHMNTLYDEVIRVPLIFRFPGRVPRGKRVGGMVRLLDVAPTILSLVDVETSPGEFGTLTTGAAFHDLSPAFSQEAGNEPQNLVALGDLEWTAGRASVRTNQSKLVINTNTQEAVEFYDLASDGAEQQNVLAEQGEAAAALLATWRDWNSRFTRINLGPERRSLGKELEDKLKSLGYIQ